MIKMSANGPGDQVTPHQVTPKTQKKWYLIRPYLKLNIIRYISRLKRSNPRKGVAPSPTPHCSSY